MSRGAAAARPAAGMRPALVAFLLRSYFLRPVNHPVLPIAILLVLFFGALHSIERTHVVAIVYATVLAHAVTGGLFTAPGAAARGEAGRFLRNLPLARSTMVRSWLTASLLYALVSLAIFAPILWREVGLPGWRFLQVFEGTDDTGHPALFVRGTDVDARGLRHEITVLWPRSPLAETLRLVPRARPLFAAYYAAMLVYLAAWQLFRESSRARGARRLLASAPLALYAVLGISVAAGYVVSPEALHEWYRTIPAIGDRVVALAAVLIVITASAGLFMARSVSRDE